MQSIARKDLNLKKILTKKTIKKIMPCNSDYLEPREEEINLKLTSELIIFVMANDMLHKAVA